MLLPLFTRGYRCHAVFSADTDTTSSAASGFSTRSKVPKRHFADAWHESLSTGSIPSESSPPAAIP